jgi:hypothetical protein
MTAMSRPVRRLLLALLAFAALAARAADPVAFISDFRGEVVMNGAGRPSFLAEMIPGTKLALGPGASASVMYVVSGEEFSLKGPGEFVVAKEGVKASKGAAPESRVPGLKAGTAILVQTSRTATASLRMRSAAAPKSERAGPLYPVNARIATLQPTLRWEADAGATHTVVVTSADGREIFRGAAKGTSLRLPVKLAAGQAYSWTSSAGGGEARFEVLPADKVARAEKARAAAKSFSERVVLAMILDEIGAAQDSREAWAQLAEERPDIPELAGLAR